MRDKLLIWNQDRTLWITVLAAAMTLVLLLLGLYSVWFALNKEQQLQVELAGTHLIQRLGGPSEVQSEWAKLSVIQGASPRLNAALEALEDAGFSGIALAGSPLRVAAAAGNFGSLTKVTPGQLFASTPFYTEPISQSKPQWVLWKSSAGNQSIYFIPIGTMKALQGYLVIQPIHSAAADTFFRLMPWMLLASVFLELAVIACVQWLIRPDRSGFFETGPLKKWMLNVVGELDTLPPLTDQSIRNARDESRQLLLAGLFRQRVFSTILRRAPNGIVVFNSKGQPIYVNRAFRDLLGYSWEDMSQMSPRERSLLMKPVPLEDTILDPKAQSGDPSIARVPYRFLHKQGHSVLVDVQTSTILSGDGTEGSILFVEQMTDYERFVRLQTQTIQIVEAAIQGIGIFSAEGHVVYVNETFSRLTCQSKEAWQQKHVEELDSAISAGFYQSIQSKSAVRGVISKLETTDAERSLSYDFMPIFSETHQPISVLVWCRDLTAELEWQMIRHQADLFHSLSQMAASMAHEVRNPMASVIGFLQLLRESRSDDAKVIGYTNVMLDEIRRVNEIISEYLSMSKTSGASWETFDLEHVLKEMALLLEGETNLRSLRLFIDTVPVQIRGDVRRVKQVLLNLAKNAIEATPSGGTIRLSVSVVDEKAVVKVADTGTGMSEQTLEQIFQPFFTTKPKGTGLGLPVCREIVEQHGGTITVESQVGAGTTFSVIFPQAL